MSESPFKRGRQPTEGWPKEGGDQSEAGARAREGEREIQAGSIS